MDFTEKHKALHRDFRLNDAVYTVVSLKAQARLFIDTGEPYEQSVGEFLLDWLNDKKYVTVQTSGSTGDPKPVKISKTHMINSALATAKHFEIYENTTALLCLPAHYIAGKMMLVRAMALGWHMDMARPTSNPLDTIYRTYDFCAMTPFQLDNSLSRLHLISTLIVGGGAISPSLQSRVQDLKTSIYETYGMTETVTHIATRRVNDTKEKSNLVPFKVLDNVQIETDDRGCLVIKAPLVSSDPVITNDLVEIITYKKFVWLGRADNVINSGGVKLYPEQIEAKLASFMHVPYFIIGVPDEQLGEKLVLFVEQENTFLLDLTSQEMEAFGSFEFPKTIVCIPTFQRTKTGKIQRGQTLKSYIASL